MASAQVGRKQEHLEAGKRKLEEFRRKKAAERAKKATQNSQPPASNGSLHETGTENLHISDSERAGASDGVNVVGVEPPGVVADNDVKKHLNSSHGTDENLLHLSNNHDKDPSVSLSSHLKENKLGENDVFEAQGKVNIIHNNLKEKENDGTVGRDAFGMGRGHLVASHPSSMEEVNSMSNQSSYYGFGMGNIPSTTNDVHLKDDSIEKPDASYSSALNVSHGNSSFGDTPLTGNNNRRSRPSFLDSINISRGSPTSSFLSGSRKPEPFQSVVHPVGSLGPTVVQNSMTSSLPSGNGVGFAGSTERNHDFYSQKQNEDFAALEQHIEDLTQEKFSLQRALEASRTLAESLAAENSGLTDSYNQQGGIVSQLKSDMERLQEQIKAQLVELESVKLQYANAQLECNAADERAKLLASEVIGLEEKALRLRSNELKLGRELENSQDEISSLKKKMSTLEKDRRDLQSTIDALQEEKKLLQSKLRKASASGSLGDVSKNLKKDVSTSTDDLGLHQDTDVAASTGDSNLLDRTASSENNLSSFPFLDDSRQISPDELHLTVPPDQMRTIQNINTLLSELTMEKEQLVQTLSEELSQSYNLKELNKELTRKLEAQTQRLELLTAQSMAGDNVLVRQPNSNSIPDNAIYADEGDEVVERVLGWIMKLFPGGPSRRRTSKLL